MTSELWGSATRYELSSTSWLSAAEGGMRFRSDMTRARRSVSGARPDASWSWALLKSAPDGASKSRGLDSWLSEDIVDRSSHRFFDDVASKRSSLVEFSRRPAGRR